jgi:hypothetical protein
VSPAVRIAVVDSGIVPGHPHVGRVAGGARIRLERGELLVDEDWRDRIGHGTAVAGVLRERIPDAELLAVRIFERALAAPVEVLLAGIRWSVRAGARFVNLSLGSLRFDLRADFEAATAEAARAGTVLVAPARLEGRPCLPGCLEGVVAVEPDPAVPRGEVRESSEGTRTLYAASPFPREVPGLPREANYSGVSFAVAYVLAALASPGGIGPRARPGETDARSRIREGK